ncbi:protein MIZU-KUSSEI 1-like [Iris pallida]|uniref:Protein MIZU-KUSSEI 1-like n=1 Tax=Iris pallida TaxID=29817 RepID=A0AAX6EXH1_IRIPA|nr:protein MIZU-KUSSEI 1-like [Iris pallida]
MVHIGSSSSATAPFFAPPSPWFDLSHSSRILTVPEAISLTRWAVGVASSRRRIGSDRGVSCTAKLTRPFFCPKKVPVSLLRRPAREVDREAVGFGVVASSWQVGISKDWREGTMERNIEAMEEKGLKKNLKGFAAVVVAVVARAPPPHARPTTRGRGNASAATLEEEEEKESREEE